MGVFCVDLSIVESAEWLALVSTTLQDWGVCLNQSASGRELGGRQKALFTAPTGQDPDDVLHSRERFTPVFR